MGTESPDEATTSRLRVTVRGSQFQRDESVTTAGGAFLQIGVGGLCSNDGKSDGVWAPWGLWTYKFSFLRNDYNGTHGLR
jgi:hypothetical protein